MGGTQGQLHPKQWWSLAHIQNTTWHFIYLGIMFPMTVTLKNSATHCAAREFIFHTSPASIIPV